MKKIICYFSILSSVCLAQIPTGYYNTAQGLTGAPLKIALHNIIDNHSQISYNALWNAYKKTDKKPNGKVWDMYSDIPSGTPPYQYTFGTDQCGSYGSEGDCYNREHSWPQSWFNSVSGPVSDLFHIYPTDGKVNGLRSNFPYGNVSLAATTTLNGSKLGPCSNPGYTLTVFEPIDEYKGDFARGYFYMSTRYYSEDAGWTNSAATSKSVILPWQMNVLLQWNQQDPVSAKEHARNDSVYYRFQHNRNPFIDHPEWADSIWSIDNTVFIKEIQLQQSFAIFPNPASSSFQIINKSNHSGNVNLKVLSITGTLMEEKIITSEETIFVDCSSWAQGLYIISLSSERAVSNIKFVKE